VKTEFTGRHDPILVPSAKPEDPWSLYKWWCPCGKGAKNPHDYETESRLAFEHVVRETRVSV